MTEASGATKSYSIPSQNPEILFSTLTPSDGMAHLLVLERDQKTSETSVIQYDQITPIRFAERQITEIPFQNLLTATAGFSRLNGGIAIYYLVQNPGKRTMELFMLGSDYGKKYSSPKPLVSVPSRPVSSAFLWNPDLNGDGIDDLVLSLGNPEDTLITYLSQKHQAYRPVGVTHSDQIRIVSKDRVKFLDVNGDGKDDMVLDNAITKSIQVFLNNGEGEFQEPFRLTTSEGFGGFALMDINRDGIPDLVVSDSSNGLVKVIFLGD
jgi:hypothetical protein